VTFDLGQSVLALKGVGATRHRQLAAQGVSTLGDLLLHVPSRYEDRRHLTEIAAVEEGGTYTLRGRLSSVKLVLRRGHRFSLVRGTLEESSGSLSTIWFNRPYLPGQVEDGGEYVLHGTVGRRGDELQLQNASLERAGEAVHSGRIVPVYSSLGEIGPALVRRLMAGALAGRSLVGEIDDPIPDELLRRHGLPRLDEALAALHLPGGEISVEQLNSGTTGAHRRLAYGELLDFHLRLRLARDRARRRVKERPLEVNREIRRRLNSLVPFELTSAQRRVVEEIVEDLASPRPMRRLLQGDVGSGKTVVAAAALVVAVENGLQGAFMAPTELLAEQHFETFSNLLGDRYRLTLLTGSSAAAAEARRELQTGAAELVIGTHALIQDSVWFDRLGLAVIDEQHRFGVAQRRELSRKGASDLLVMTATPIPRSLTLTAYGDLDLSVIDELPPGRIPVATELARYRAREDVYSRVEEDLERGGRVFVVFPVIQGGTDERIPSLERGVEWLRQRFPAVGIGVAHGQVPPEQRSAVMKSFEDGTISLLAATTVIEVGVDVPAASIMVIEGAERFGLAQLHQLRGRVGRGNCPSTCFALHGRLTESGRKRLETFAGTTDGFEIAEADLEIRGPGEVLGTRQAGVPQFRVADLRRDADWLERAREDARALAGKLTEAEILALIARFEWQSSATEARAEA
jgi:ATP-dependent DNA helicase RecG